MRTKNVIALSASFALTLLATSTAQAHIEMTSPKPRYADQKTGPCGKGARDARTSNVNTFKPGETITVTWDETVPHPGHYRISFDPNGSSAFTDPATAAERSTAAPVLVDGIADKAGTGSYSQEVTLPDVECDSCTLQLIQVMTDKPPFGDGNDVYYQCADITLSRDAAGEVEADAGSNGSTGSSGSSAPAESSGCTTGAHSSSGGVGFAVATLAIASARRRLARKPR